MRRKLVACAAAAAVTIGGSLFLSTPARAAAFFCPTGWWQVCYPAPPGCRVVASCVVIDGEPHVDCSYSCG